ncbi:MAG TPA: hypothetical protein VH560_01540 [Polyangia bacterium]|nr:hypothetical protein [Polyangia bacterium]
MRTASLVRVPGLLGLLVAGLVGCGLISSDITKLTIDLPARTYTFDTSTFNLPQGMTTKVPCGGSNAVQTCPSPTVCLASVCSVEQPVGVSSTINLKMDSPELASLSDQHLANVTLESLRYSAVSTLNVASPPFDLYLAAAGVTDSSSAMAMKFGTIPAIPAGASQSGDIVKTAAADSLFTKYATNVTTPFNVLAVATVIVPSGSPTPTGKISITITGSISAKPSL